MTQVKHTPGPWKVGMGGSIRCAYTDSDGDDIIIGGIKNRSIQIGSAPFTTPSKKQQEANACLMAAAPEMYEALKKLNARLDGGIQNSWAKNLQDVIAPAIAKAEGQS